MLAHLGLMPATPGFLAKAITEQAYRVVRVILCEGIAAVMAGALRLQRSATSLFFGRFDGQLKELVILALADFNQVFVGHGKSPALSMKKPLLER
jgi:hypothetical protein